jgi:pyruvate formate lyase activating enzyme
VLSFGTAGCNLACRFCQNWDISKARQDEVLATPATPHAIADVAARHGCRSVAFTYNDPVIFHEYAVETARACRETGLRTVAVTAGFVCPGPRAEFYVHMDAANIDLKSFSDDFYQRFCAGRLQPVLDTLDYVANETETWLEVTTLLIPGLNDSDTEIDQLTSWAVEHLGPDVPLHFSAFHPDFKMLDRPRTSIDTLLRARGIASDNGIHHVYTGNVDHPESQATRCHGCGEVVIGRTGYDVAAWHLDEVAACATCSTPCPGVFDVEPGDWGSQRRPLRTVE